jgi:hypothetical protein
MAGRRFAGPLLIGVVLLGLVAGCGGGPSAPPAPPAPVRVSPEAYQQLLNTTNAALAASWRSVASAGPYDAVGGTVAAAGTATGRAADELARTNPPAGLDEAHGALLAGLRQLVDDLSGLSGQVRSFDLCATPSVTSRLSTASGTDRLREAAVKLRAAGMQWAEFTGDKVPLPDYRMANGAVVSASRRGGLGQLTVTNGNEKDAVLTLAQGSAPVLSMYVRHNDKAVLRQILDGTYQVFYTLGADWSVPDRLFTRACEFAQFDQAMTFTTAERSNGTEYTTYEVTLQPVLGGTARTSSVEATSYPR